MAPWRDMWRHTYLNALFTSQLKARFFSSLVAKTVYLVYTHLMSWRSAAASAPWRYMSSAISATRPARSPPVYTVTGDTAHAHRIDKSCFLAG